MVPFLYSASNRIWEMPQVNEKKFKQLFFILRKFQGESVSNEPLLQLETRLDSVIRSPEISCSCQERFESFSPSLCLLSNSINAFSFFPKTNSKDRIISKLREDGSDSFETGSRRTSMIGGYKGLSFANFYPSVISKIDFLTCTPES